MQHPAELSDAFRVSFLTATEHEPFPYQTDLAVRSRLPELLRAPTGAGKTAATVLGWAWRRRGGHAGLQDVTPRRLVFCLPMRSLVSQTAVEARRWFERLGWDIPVHVLMGGAVDQRWDANPEGDCLIIGTQDQLLSRALNRGYAMSRFRWPIHFAWLNNDALWVIDEVQLMGAALSTTAQLDAFRSRLGTLGSCHTIWCSATLDARLLATVDNGGRRFDAVELGPADRATSGMQRRLTAHKRLRQEPLPFDKDAKKQAVGLATLIADVHDPAHRTLVVLNRVDRAIALYRELRSRGHAAHLLHSRYRPSDRQQIEEAALGRGRGGVLVATQAVEAGVDITAKVLITDLAPWSSLVQRFGRCNRYGEHSAEDPALVYWIDVADAEAAPYEAAALGHARALLASHREVGPAALSSGHPETVVPGSPVLRMRDFQDLFDTTPDLSGLDIDVSPFIREGDADVQLAWRDVPKDPGQVVPPLQRDELCRVPIGRAAQLLKRGKAAWEWDSLEGNWRRRRPHELVPGRAYLLRIGSGGYSSEVGFTGNEKDIPEAIETRHVAHDADEREPLSHSSGRFVSLEEHSVDARREASALSAQLGLPGALGDAIVEAAQWHDLGKAHPVWQAMIRSGADEASITQGGPWAKSDGKPTQRATRPHFRHELGSALAVLAHYPPTESRDLIAYLVAAHHGKIRLTLRSRPTEPAPTDGRRLALGHQDGDLLPEVDLGDGLVVPETRVSLELMELGSTAGSWSERVFGLLDQYGALQLSYLEALVRIADWRASSGNLQEAVDA